MKIEYLASGSQDCPLVRLFDFAPAEVQRLRSEIFALASGTARTVVVHELPGVESIGGCRLTFITDRRDRGIVHIAEPADFECRLTPTSWDNVATLAEPFLEPSDGYYQWLNHAFGGDVGLLLSPSGEW
jgi:hypothetical protein